MTHEMHEKPILESKSYQIFRSNNEWLNTHIQLVDAALVNAIRTLKTYPKKEKSIGYALSSAEYEKYNCLNHPVRQYSPILRQSQNRTIEFAICQMYRHFIDYLHSIVYEMYKHNPRKVVEKLCTKDVTKSISFYDLIQLESFDKVEWHIVDTVFRGLENLRNTPKLLSKILICGGVEDKVKCKMSIEKVMRYLELRHLYIHNKGKYDAKYVNNYSIYFAEKISEGNKISSTYTLFKSAQEEIFLLCSTIDKALLENNMVSSRIR